MSTLIAKSAPVATLLGAFLLTASAAVAQTVAFTGNYTQNFDSMGTSGTAAPTGWSVESEAGTHDTFSYWTPSGGYATVLPNFSAGTMTAEPTLVAGTPTTQKGLGGYNFGTSSDRSLGTSPSGDSATIIVSQYINQTGSSISDLSLSYDIRRFSTTTTNNSAYTGGPYSGVEENPGYQLFYSLDNGSSWTNVASLNPTLSGSVAVPNSIGTTNVSDNDLALSSAWTAGGKLELAWFDDNAQSPSPDQLLGLDNVVLGVSAVPEPISFASVLGASALLFGCYRRRRLAKLV
jgi:hypothetical protein